tara:strand:+ start:3381 stop:4040 length:660 start_codon:yes stop_codon:yes gene_type:complete
MKEAVIVGSGASLLGSGLGTKIDSIETVFRFKFKNFSLQEYCHDTGIKTDVMISNCNHEVCALHLRDLKRGLMKKFGIKKLVFSSTRRASHRRHAWKALWKYVKKNKIDATIFRYDEGGKVVLDGLGIDYKGLSFRHSWTAGLNSLVNLLNNYYKFHPVHFEEYRFDKIYLCGFDYLTDTPSTQHFYKRAKVTNWHNLDSEAKIIRQLIEKTDKVAILR